MSLSIKVNLEPREYVRLTEHLFYPDLTFLKQEM